MTHEGRMLRGAEKISKGITDSETIYYLANKPKEEPKEEVTMESKDTEKTLAEKETKEVAVEDITEETTEEEMPKKPKSNKRKK